MATCSAIAPCDVAASSPTPSKWFGPLSETQLHEFYDEIDREGRGFVSFGQLTEKIQQVIDDVFSPSNSIHRLLETQPRLSEDVEKGSNKFWIQSFLQSLFPGSDDSRVSKNDFVARARSWNIPAPATKASPQLRPPLIERLWAGCEVEAPRIALVALLLALQLAFGFWQMIKYIQSPTIRSAFGWGVILSKAAAGAIYPTFFFLLLSMSRYFATFTRRFKYVPRILNWDRSQSTHVWLASVGLALATLHAIGYLGGSFIHGSKAAHEVAVQKVFGSRTAPKSYAGFVKELPGWTGITALGLYWIIAVLSTPMVRSRSYEAFQLAHLLMFPMLGLLCAHGTLAILQKPMLGYWLALPLFLVLLERSSRLAHGCRQVMAPVEVLDEYTVTIIFEHPRGNWWNYEAGQYIFLQVPSISYFQWHPFTISSCNGKIVQVHIQTQGNWTRRLRTLATKENVRIGVDGPFGAPAQRFYEFDRAIILGAGVGITPFSAIITDLEQKLVHGIDPWAEVRHTDGLSTSDQIPTKVNNLPSSFIGPSRTGSTRDEETRATRRVDFHWIVREREDLLWFASLLNRAHDLSLALPPSTLDLKINTYVTTRHKDLSTYVFRHLLDAHRPSSAPYSPLTGLKMHSRLGRPNFGAVLDDFHNDLKRTGWTGGKVGVFFCGSAHIGRTLSEACTKLNSKTRKDGSKTKYIFIMEVFS